MTAFGTVASAVDAMKRGAADYLTKPVDLDELEVLVQRSLERRALESENRELRQQLESKHRLQGLDTASAAMAAAINTAGRAAASRATILISGESGTGKELLARAIHLASPRARRPFVAVNIAALPETLVESELFGHERGAFTGADRELRGRFELADGGTLLLDEVGELPRATQVKLLRVLQEQAIERLGGTRTVRLDVRVIAATNRDLRQLVADGRFQEDLYYRLNVIPIHIPPLRERREDIPVLVEHFIGKHAQRAGKRIERVEDGLMPRLQAYDWPGNVRELENTIERAVVLSASPMIRAQAVVMLGAIGAPPSGLPGMNLRQNLDWTERETVRRALENAGGVKKDAAETMGISQRALSYYLAKHRIE
jgi:two-component system NtrC family response regulator